MNGTKRPRPTPRETRAPARAAAVARRGESGAGVRARVDDPHPAGGGVAASLVADRDPGRGGTRAASGAGRRDVGRRDRGEGGAPPVALHAERDAARALARGGRGVQRRGGRVREPLPARGERALHRPRRDRGDVARRHPADRGDVGDAHRVRPRDDPVVVALRDRLAGADRLARAGGGPLVSSSCTRRCRARR